MIHKTCFSCKNEINNSQYLQKQQKIFVHTWIILIRLILQTDLSISLIWCYAYTLIWSSSTFKHEYA